MSPEDAVRFVFWKPRLILRDSENERYKIPTYKHFISAFYKNTDFSYVQYVTANVYLVKRTTSCIIKFLIIKLYSAKY